MSSPRGRAPVYQIDFMAVQSGKRIASSKRRVRWRFGFANTQALAAGDTGTNCRGEEHDITLVWSLTSGKRMIIADGQEVHYSNSRSNMFDFSWTMKGNNILKIVAHASPPLSPTPGFRQYDFFVNGQSFFSFPKVFRLGLASNDPRDGGSPPGPPRAAESSKRYNRSASGSVHGIASIEAPGNQDEEEMYLQEAIRQSLQDDAKTAASTPAPATADLLDFGAPSPAPAVVADVFAGALVPAPSSGYGGASNPYALTPAAVNPYGGAPAYGAPGNPYGAAPSVNQYGAAAPQPQQQQSSNPYGAPSGDTFAKPQASLNPYAVGQPNNNNPYDTTHSVMSATSFTAPPANPQASNPYAPAPVANNPYAPQPANPYAPAPVNPYAPQLANPYAPAPVASNPYTPSHGSAPAVGVRDPYAPSTNNAFAVPAPASNPYGTAPAPTNPHEGVPAPFSTNQHASGMSNGGAPQQQKHYEQTGNDFAVSAENHANSDPYSTPGADMKSNGWQMNGGVPFGVITPRGDQTPSSLGFGSPPADFSGFSPVRDEPKPPDIGGSKLDQAYFKLANLDTFSLASKKDEERANPFETGSITETRSLADIAKATQKSNKEIMRSHALVVSNNQTNNYASQYGVIPQQPPMGQPQAQPQYGQQQTQPPIPFGVQQQQTQTPNPFGQQQPQYGQPLPQGQPPQYGQPNAYGVGKPQAQFGQAPYVQQQQQPQYGQQQPLPQAYGQPQQQPINPPPPMQQYGAPPFGRQQFGTQGY